LPSQANFVFASHSEASGVSLTRALKADGILVRSWDNDRLRAWVRITVGTPEQQARLIESLSRILS
jgi:histidinol-phosphate aminotransferase